MTMINTLQELLEALPLNSKSAGPCPFCGEGNETVHNGVKFYGADRFYLFSDGRGWGCRRCRQKNRGPTNKGWYPHAAVAEKVNLVLSENFIEEYSSGYSGVYDPNSNPLQFQTYAQAVNNHKKVMREYWRGFGWSDDVIDRFKLGYGKISTWHTSGHLIPMDVTLTTDGEKIPGYYNALRAAGHKIKQKGSSKNHVWHVQDDPYLDTCVITEGEKDLITAYQLGHKNVLCTFSSYWNDNFSKFVAAKYNKVIIYRDLDEAGADWLALVIPSLLSLGVSVNYLDWEKVENSVNGDDLTDYFVKVGDLDDCNKILTKAFVHKESQIKRSEENNEKPVSIELIRGNDPGSLRYEINHFLRNYTYKAGKGKSLLLSTGPGAGKTHTLYQIAEKQAVFYKEKKMKEYERLLSEFELLEEEVKTATEDEKVELVPFVEKQRGLLNRYSFNSVAWYAPYKNGIEELLNMGADPDLWYDFRARSEDNCKSSTIVDKLGENHHAIGEFCELSCPHFNECQASGYLHQREEMRSYPIIFYRHEHLPGLPPTSVQLVILDESVIKVVESPLVFSSSELFPFREGWELDIDEEDVIDVLKFFIKALRSTATFNSGELSSLPEKKGINPAYILHGNQIFALLDKFYESHNRELSEVLLLNRSVIKAYQPSFLSGDISSIKKRCLPAIVEAVQRELGTYAYDKEADRPSTMNIVAGDFEIYSPPRIRLPARIPLIIADATPLLELYQAIFQREIRVYSPVFRGDNTEIVVVYGSDWSRSYVKSQLSGHMANVEDIKKKALPPVLIEGIPQILDGYLDSSIFSDIVHLLEYLKNKHRSLLMVTHKNLREFVESLLDGAYSGIGQDTANNDQVSWGHYGALRGTNKYKDYEAICLIGAFRIPYDVLWRRAQLWAYGLGIKESIPQELIKKDQDYNYVDGSVFGKYTTFSHWLADKLVNHIERGEMIQCAHRIRPHSNADKKTIYIFATRPITELATKLINKNKLLKAVKKTTYSQLLSFLKKYYGETGKLPTYKETKIQFKVSNTTIKEARKEVVSA